MTELNGDQGLPTFPFRDELVPPCGEGSSHCKHFVFYHIPRTAGSSIWHALGSAAAAVKLPIVDLFYLAQRDFGNTELAYSVLNEKQHWLRQTDSLIHLHTPHNISCFLRDENTIYATIVRDPVDRLISDIWHLRRALPPNPEDARRSLIGRAQCRPRFVDALLGAEPAIESVVEMAAQEQFFQNYYYFHFYSLLCGEPCPLPTYPAPKNENDVRLVANRAKERFAYVGRFPDVGVTFREIANRFALPLENQDNFTNHLNATKSDSILPDRYKRFGMLFESSYELLRELGVDFTANL